MLVIVNDTNETQPLEIYVPRDDAVLDCAKTQTFNPKKLRQVTRTQPYSGQRLEIELKGRVGCNILWVKSRTQPVIQLKWQLQKWHRNETPILALKANYDKVSDEEILNRYRKCANGSKVCFTSERNLPGATYSWKRESTEGSFHLNVQKG